jgi:hypothetical protein
VPFPAVADLKAYLRVQHAEDDALLALLLARATALVQGVVTVPILAAARTVAIDAEDHSAYGARAVLYVPGMAPIAEDPAPIIVDPDGEAVLTANYQVDPRAGRFIAVAPYVFARGLHAVTAKVGWSAHPDYATLYEPLLAAAITDAVADWYQRRNPGAVTEGAGGRVYTQWAATLELPARLRGTLQPMRRIGVR